MKFFTNKQWKAFREHQIECTRNVLIKAGVENQDIMADELVGNDKPRPSLIKEAHTIAEDWVGYLFRI
jgi:aminoglycoside N3'-acetyltransferase